MPNRRTIESLTRPEHDPVAANQVIFEGYIVCLNASGFAVRGAEATGLIARGVAQNEVNNTGGADGDKVVKSFIGAWLFDVKAGDEPTQADVGSLVYITSPYEVGKTATGRSPAGYLLRIDQSGQAVVEIDGKVHV